ncbi:MAG: hypothetical protein GTO03_08910, partial [Planctomycetales bacterium]|nr:hypothetical protein [Planctomycetales bacterium]
MLIRFSCPHCQRKLKARSDKAAQRLPCPNCRQILTVPAGEAAEPAPPVSGTTATADPFAELIVYDDQLVYETDEPPAGPTTGGPPARPPHWVGVSRQLIYLHAGLLLVVPLTALAVGYLIGRTDRPRGASLPPAVPARVLITGRLQWRGTTGPLADKGAVVIAVPQDLQPPQKLPGQTLGPDQPLPAQGDQRVRTIEDWGGDYVRTNEVGEFQLFLLPGRYYLLAISRQSRRLTNAEPDRADLAAIGKFFTAPHELIGSHPYHWTAVDLA